MQRQLAEQLKAEIIGTTRGHLWEQVELPLWLKTHGGGLLTNLANTAPVYYDNKIVTVYDVAFLVNPAWYSKSFHIYYKIVIPKLARNAKHLVTATKFSKDEIVKYLGVGEAGISVIGGAVSNKFRRPQDELSDDYGKYILALSAGSPRKNFERIVLAFQRIRDKQVKLIIVGSPNKHISDRRHGEAVMSDPRIVFTNYVTDSELSGLYARALFFVFPSLYEGFGIPPLEAMACGCACLVSDAASLPEVCGSAALFCDPYSIDDIATKMELMLADYSLRQRLVVLGYEQIKRFDWDHSAAMFAELLDEKWDL